MSPSDALAPPPDGDVNKGQMLLTTSIVTTIIALLSLLLRCLVRTRIVNVFGWDDVAMCFGVVLAMVEMPMFILQVRYGMGRHLYYLEKSPDFVLVVKYADLCEPFVILTTTFVKASLCLFLLRIVEGMKVHRMFLWGMVAITLTINAAAAISIFTQCHPQEKLWDPNIPGDCPGRDAKSVLAFLQTSWAILSDLLLAGSPMLLFWRLRIPYATKVIICCLMGLALL
ncbi:hypothetical protein F5B20DRAFT_576751 [Whalleya microplaca]|nr:hypothetical protein F5B20DRAFT_576751 [Whalleya microplaca]